MKLGLGLPLLIVGAMLQGTVFSHLRVQDGQPDFVLLLAVSWSLLDSGPQGMVWAFTGGLFLDLFSGAPPGLSSLGLTLAAYVAGLGRGRLANEHLILPPVMIIAGTLIYHTVTLVLLVATGLQPAIWADNFRYVTLPSSLFNLAFIMPIFAALRLIYRRQQRRLQVTVLR